MLLDVPRPLRAALLACIYTEKWAAVVRNANALARQTLDEHLVGQDEATAAPAAK